MRKQLTSIVFILVSLAILYFYIRLMKFKNNNNEENFINRNHIIDISREKLNIFGLPDKNKIKENIAYISIYPSGEVAIYKDVRSRIKTHMVHQKGILVARTTKPFKLHRFAIKYNSKNNDRFMFYSRSKNLFSKEPHSGANYFAAHIYYNGKFYVSNNYNFKVVGVENRSVGRIRKNKSSLTDRPFNSGYKKIGCFKDKSLRLLPHWHYRGLNIDHERCKELAGRYRQRLFSVQDDGKCFSGSNLRKSTSAGKRNEEYCNRPAIYKKEGWYTKMNPYLLMKNRTTSASYSNYIHEVNKNPAIRIVGKNEGKWVSTRNLPLIKGKSGKLFKETLAIQADVGGNQKLPNFYGHSIWNRWVQFEFKIKYIKNIGFCPDKEYIEFNPAGCRNPRGPKICQQTSIKNYTGDMNFCKTKIYQPKVEDNTNANNYDLMMKNKNFYQDNNYNNIQFFSQIKDFFNVLASMKTQFRKLPKTNSNKKKIIEIKGIVSKAIKYYKNTTDIACKMISNIKPKFTVINCNRNTNRSLYSKNNDFGTEFMKIINEAYLTSRPEIEEVQGKSPNYALRERMEDELKGFLEYSKMAIIKTNFLLSSCPCLENSKPNQLNNKQARWYLNRYRDLKRAFGNNLGSAKRHWIRYGKREKREWLPVSTNKGIKCAPC